MKRTRLEKNGALTRHSFNEIPPRVEYRLTVEGRGLVEAILSLTRRWEGGRE